MNREAVEKALDEIACASQPLVYLFMAYAAHVALPASSNLVTRHLGVLLVCSIRTRPGCSLCSKPSHGHTNLIRVVRVYSPAPRR